MIHSDGWSLDEAGTRIDQASLGMFSGQREGTSGLLATQ